MRSIFVLIINMLIMSYIAPVTYSQQTSFPVLKFYPKGENFIYFDKPVLKNLKFHVDNISPETKKIWEDVIAKNSIVEKVIFQEKENEKIIGGFIFKQESSFLMLRPFFEELHIDYFYVNDNKVLTKTLINSDEIQKLVLNSKLKGFIFTAECNDSTRMEYHDFQVQYAKSKLLLMLEGNYPKYLFEGHIAEFTEQLENAVVKRNSFIKSNQK